MYIFLLSTVSFRSLFYKNIDIQHSQELSEILLIFASLFIVNNLVTEI